MYLFSEKLFKLLTCLVLGELAYGIQFLGCYVDKIRPRLLNGLQSKFPGTLTPQLCKSHCQSKNFRYAGVQYRQECFCSNSRPTFTAYAPIEECDMTCEGDESQICGGGLRSNVYDLDAKKGDNHVAQNYMGCFIDRQGARTLFGYEVKDLNRLTPEMCLGICFSKGFRFAGVQNSKECFCGDQDPTKRKQADSECNSPCGGDDKLICGGPWKLSIYKTGILDLAHTRYLLGCYKDEDENNRLLFENKMNLLLTNSPRKCFNICTMLGYKFAGVQYGVECFCGNRTPSLDLEVDSSECDFPCPGSGETLCGGDWRLLTLKTGSIKGLDITSSSVSNQNLPLRPPRPTTVVNPLQGSCKTTVNGSPICEPRIIFHDDFSSNDLSPDKWSHFIFLPAKPDHEFVVFDTDPANSFIKNGQLCIHPTVLPDTEIRAGTINLTHCTLQSQRSEFGMCAKQASGYNILPPIKSARVSTKDSFSFKYGEVTVRARLPLGDWLIPEIWLEPKNNAYGPGYKSGRIKIVTARGNLHLQTEDGDEIGIRTIESGVLVGNGIEHDSTVLERKITRNMSLTENQVKEIYKVIQFHDYTIRWTPDNIIFFIDGKKQGSILPETNGNKTPLSRIMGFQTDTVRRTESSVTPFDQEFYLVLGVSAGGMRYFPDKSYTGDRSPKPWVNFNIKAEANFWRAKTEWSRTWSTINNFQNALVIDSITVKSI